MSTNKTTNLNLHAWEPEDRFIRSEFNENFAAIDRKAGEIDGQFSAMNVSLGSLQRADTTLQQAIDTEAAARLAGDRFRLLYSRTLTAAANTVSIPLTSLNLTKYAVVLVVAEPPAPSEMYLRSFAMYADGDMTRGNYSLDGVGQYGEYHYDQSYFYSTAYGSCIGALLRTAPGASTCCCTPIELTHGTGDIFQRTSVYKKKKLGTLHSLDFAVLYQGDLSSDKLPAGMRFALFGLLL